MTLLVEYSINVNYIKLVDSAFQVNYVIIDFLPV